MKKELKSGNLFDYLAWRGDVPFSADAFNEVDNLILAELAYTDFEGIVPADGEPVSIRDACRMFFSCHTAEEILADKSFTAKAALLLPDMAEGERFRDTRLCFYRARRSMEEGMQFAAVTFLLADGTVVAAFRGTDGTLAGWKEDFRFSYLSGTEGQQMAAEYLSMVGLRTGGAPLRVTGHSKGGNLAVYAAACCDPRVQEKMTEIWTNDGPGFRPEFLEMDGYRKIRSRISFIIPENCLFGMLLEHNTEPRVIQSSASGWVQHDGFTWQVMRDRFVPGKLTSTSEVVKRSLKDWLNQMDDQARKDMTETLFTLLESTGADTIDGMEEQRLKTVLGIMNTAMEMPREEKNEMAGFMNQLKESGKQAAADYLQSLAAEKIHSLFNRGGSSRDE